LAVTVVNTIKKAPSLFEDASGNMGVKADRR
jgi:hypothetical protein